MKWGGGCRRRCWQAGAHPRGLPPGTGEALRWPIGPTSDGPGPRPGAGGGSAQARLLSGGRVGWRWGWWQRSTWDLGCREGSVSPGVREDEGTDRKASMTSPPSTALQPLEQNPAGCPRGRAGWGRGTCRLCLPCPAQPVCADLGAGWLCPPCPCPHAHGRTTVVRGSCSADANMEACGWLCPWSPGGRQ